jgi:thiamine biosynthesis lipoprotein
VDDTKGTAFLTRKGMRAHLGGIGKGYAVDRAAAIMRGRGLQDFMIQSGGDLYVAGRRGDRPWRAGIQDPRGPAAASSRRWTSPIPRSARQETTSGSS